MPGPTTRVQPRAGSRQRGRKPPPFCGRALRKGRARRRPRVLVATASLHNQAGRATMAGHDSGSQHQFTGFQKYFNSYTMVGRRNYVIATYTGVAMLILYFKLRSKKKTPAVADK
uniref:ATP synthase membrane subunit DAPIT n=1 Tax=Anas platyrhynchos platyrhynchos TaxID=8840 RepID=A0A493TF14_ANAPP|eukprot:XP_027316498.1 up-regulated during skeletal muscle growth protein 5 isoform X1 [Anas platyrhynchos]